MNKVLFSVSQPLICAVAEAEAHKYNYIKKGNATYFWAADVENSGDFIYCAFPDDKTGFAERILSFETLAGEVIHVAGPWHSNPQYLFEETGIDLRNKCYTFGIIAEERITVDYYTDYYDKVHLTENTWQLGTYDRIEALAKEYANLYGKPMYFASVSIGGSCRAMVRPG